MAICAILFLVCFNSLLNADNDCVGLLAVADTSNHVIRLINLTGGNVSTIAGQPGVPGWSPDGPPSSSILSSPVGITFGPPTGSVAMDIVWSETGSGIIRRYNGQVVYTVAGTPLGFGLINGPALSSKFGGNGPQGLAFFGNDLFIADNGMVSRLLLKLVLISSAASARSSGFSLITLIALLSL